ncbi:MAG: ECF RNA polymerase sigma factor SigW [Firmicutes bacterium ADurb.Bin419]|nr:MAG: ECF RNA polymerase sigma factor SigW [Firmicutes bacterium ADurb.Bin419]
MDIADKRQMINHCQLGDLDSFEKLYILYKNKAMGTAYLIGGSKSIAEDIVLEAFVTCYYQIKNLKNPDVFDIWFYRTLVRIGWRMASKHKNYVGLENTDFEQKDTTGYIGTSDFYDKSNDRMLVRQAVKKLDPQLKNVVILYYFNEFTTKEIAKILDCFQGTVKSRLYKARKLLEKELKNCINEENQFETSRKEIGLHEK